MNVSSESRSRLNRNSVSEPLRTRQFNSRAVRLGAPNATWTATPMGPPDVNTATRRPRDSPRKTRRRPRSTRSPKATPGFQTGRFQFPRDPARKERFEHFLKAAVPVRIVSPVRLRQFGELLVPAGENRNQGAGASIRRRTRSTPVESLPREHRRSWPIPP